MDMTVVLFLGLSRKPCKIRAWYGVWYTVGTEDTLITTKSLTESLYQLYVATSRFSHFEDVGTDVGRQKLQDHSHFTCSDIAGPSS
jgi:hypothetical protein